MTSRKHPHDPSDPHEAASSRSSASGTSSMESKLSELESAAAESKDRYLRLAADFDNFKRRSRQEHLETIQHASADLIARLLPALDDLHNALEHKPEGVDDTWARGIELAVRKLEDTLRTHGLEPIEAAGRHFDPKLHEAIGHEETSEVPEDTVVTQLRPGYRVRDRVVRPALVRVARPPASLPADTESDSPDR